MDECSVCEVSESYAHHVSFEEVHAEFDDLDALVHAVHALGAVGEDDVRLLVKASQHSLRYTRTCQRVAWEKREEDARPASGRPA
jgi:hypothetical protein